jgi:predicted kinase
VALVGMPAAGKSTVAKILQQRFGFNWVRTRDVVRLFSPDGAIANLQATGANLAGGVGAETFCKELFKRVEPDRSNVIDAIRPIEHWQRIKDEYGARAILISIVAPLTLRQKRISDAGRGESIRARDEHQVEADIPALIEESAFTVVNQNHLEFRVQQLVTFLEYISNGGQRS